MAYVDFKVTIWERVHFDDNRLDEVKEKIENGSVACSTDMFTEFEDRVAYDSELLNETAEQLSPKENDNQSTIELFNSNCDIICTNEIK